MFEKKQNTERTSGSSLNGGTRIHPPDAKTRLATTESARATHREKDLALSRQIVIGEKRRGWPVWLREAIGWGVALGILALFLVLQIFLNRSFSGLANTIALGLSVFVEIGLIWFWDLFWY
jgi:hypothetical protein